MNTIIFGSKRLGQQLSAVSAGDKYADRPVVTVEANKGARKSRRLLFNTKASQLLGLDNGDVQELVFASVEGDNRQVLVANKSLIPAADQENVVSYKTSKNRVANGEDTKEKSKAITSSFFCKEVYSFLNLDENGESAEFYLTAFPSNDIEAHALVPVGQEPVIETNGGSKTMAEVQDSVTTEIARQEAADNILIEDETEAIEDFNGEVEAIEVVEEEEVAVETEEEDSGSDWDLDSVVTEEEDHAQAAANVKVQLQEEESEWN